MAPSPTSSIYDLSAQTLNGQLKPLADYRGRVLLIVNVASKCGFTPQYEGLEALQRKHHARGFDVLGFPCNQFGAQEPGDAAEIASFCSTTYQVDFPMFAKVEVNGPKAHPLYAFLKSARPGLLGIGAIKWNFTKFGIGRDGQVAARWAPTVKPQALEEEIEALLAA